MRRGPLGPLGPADGLLKKSVFYPVRNWLIASIYIYNISMIFLGCVKTVTVSEFHSDSLLVAVSRSWSRQALGFRFVEPWDVLWSQIRVRDATSGTCCAAEIDEGHHDQDQGQKNDVGMGEEVAGWCSQISNKLKKKPHE